MKKRVMKALSIILTVMMLIGVVPIGAMTAFAADVKEDSISLNNVTDNTVFIDPVTHNKDVPEGYIGIYSVEDLLAIDDVYKNIGSLYINKEWRSAYAFSGQYILMNNIDVQNTEFTSLGDYNNIFIGIFNGNGYSITGLKQPLFYKLGDGAVVRNLSVNINCDSYGVIGGLSRYAYNAKITNCITTGVQKINGVTTQLYPEMLTSSSRRSGSAFVGGIVGYATSLTVIDKCYSSTEILIDINMTSGGSAGSFSPEVVVGGITGNGGSVKNSFNTGNINVKNADMYFPEDRISVTVGGISGQGFLIDSCYNVGNLNAEFVKNLCIIGGISGDQDDQYDGHNTVINCYNAGNIYYENREKNYYSEAYISGIVGKYSNRIECCYNLGNVSTPNYFDGTYVNPIYAGIANGVDGVAALKNTYFLEKLNYDVEESNNIRSLTIEEMSDQISFEGFDFDKTWQIKKESAYPFPVLIDLPMAILKYDGNDTLTFKDSCIFVDVNESYQATVYDNNIPLLDNRDILWRSDDTNVFSVNTDGVITGISEGSGLVWIHSKENYALTDSCLVFVGKANEFKHNTVYDSTQYYSSRGKFSCSNYLESDYIKLQCSFKNAVADALKENVNVDITDGTIPDISPITITATIDGTGLSFSKDVYQNTYTATTGAVKPEETIIEELKLYPNNFTLSPDGNSYTVKLKIESDSFETITEEYNFTVKQDEKVIELYSSLPALVIGKDMSVEFVAVLKDNGNVNGKYNDFSIAVSNGNIAEVQNIEKKDGATYFNIKGKNEGDVKLTLTELNTGTVYTTEIHVDSGILTFNAESLPKYYDGKFEYNGYVSGMFIDEYKCNSISDEESIISFNVYNSTSLYGVVDVYNADGQLIKSQKIDRFGNNTVSSIADTLWNGYKLLEDIGKHEVLTYKQDSYTKCTPISVTVPKGGRVEVTNNVVHSFTCEMYNVTAFTVETLLVVGDIADSMKAAKEISDEAAKTIIENYILKGELNDSFKEVFAKVIFENSGKPIMESSITGSITSFVENSMATFETAGIDLQKIILEASVKSGLSIAEDALKKAMGTIGAILDGMFKFSQFTDLTTFFIEIMNPTDMKAFSIYLNTLDGDLSDNGVTIGSSDSSDSLAGKNFVMHSVVLGDDDLGEKVLDSLNGISDKYIVRNIYLERDGVVSQPGQTVQVSIPIPDNYNRNNCFVYWVKDDGSLERVKAQIIGNNIVFTTDHFSLYAIVDETDRVYKADNITLDKTQLSFTVGESFTLTATVTPDNATDKTVVWTSSDTNVATVDENGNVTAVGAGTAVITATTANGLIATCTVTVNNPIPETPANLKITSNGQDTGNVYYVKLPKVVMQYKQHSTTLGFEFDKDVEVASVKWSYANWSVKSPEANIENPDSPTTVIRPNGKGIGARSTWITLTVTDTDGNVYQDTVKVRFYKWDWQVH